MIFSCRLSSFFDKYLNEPIKFRCSIHRDMMTSSNGNTWRVTGPMCEEFTGHQWIPLTKASNVELWCFLWSAPWINCWLNNRKAGDLRRHRPHYDVIVIVRIFSQHCSIAISSSNPVCNGRTTYLCIYRNFIQNFTVSYTKYEQIIHTATSPLYFLYTFYTHLAYQKHPCCQVNHFYLCIIRYTKR